MSPEEDRTRDAVDSEPKHYQLSYSGPLNWRINRNSFLAKQSYKYTDTCLRIHTYTVTCTNIHLPTYKQD